MRGPRTAAAAALLMLPLSACAAGSHSLEATPRPVSPPPATMVYISDVRTGMCLDTARLPAGGRVAYLEVLGCEVDHTGEVFAVIQEDTASTLPDGSRCWDDYQAYVGSPPDRTGNGIRALTAATDAWHSPRPAPLVCVAVSAQPRTGSVRGTGD